MTHDDPALAMTVRSDTRRNRLSRRLFVTAGAMAAAGPTLADALRSDALAGTRGSRKSIINVHLDGGPPQMDTIDPKPDAPAEIRGEFKSIRTSIPGLTICEHLPQLAKLADKFVFIRSLVGAGSAHDAFQCQSGFTASALRSVGGRPAMGTVLSKLWGQPNDVAPLFADLMQGRPLVRNSARPGFLGSAFTPFRPDISHLFHRELEDAMKKELANLGRSHSVGLHLAAEITRERLAGRRSLLKDLNQLRADAASSDQFAALDQFQQQAFRILTSGRVAEAMDLAREDPHVLDRYTLRESPGRKPHYTSDDGNSVRKFLLARRLIEAGVRCVSISMSDFDTHSKNFPRMQYLLPIVDHGLCALVTDLEQRGMLDDVSIVVWGEFGRTPRIDSKSGGRHHWPRVGMALLAGGGMQTGQVLGATDRHAAEATDRPIHYQDVFATLYQNLGIDANAVALEDNTGRPHHLLTHGRVIQEVV